MGERAGSGKHHTSAQSTELTQQQYVLGNDRAQFAISRLLHHRRHSLSSATSLRLRLAGLTGAIGKQDSGSAAGPAPCEAVLVAGASASRQEPGRGGLGV